LCRDRRSELSRKLWSARELASYLGVTERSVRRWQREGRLRPVRFAGTVRFTQEAVQALIGPENGETPDATGVSQKTGPGAGGGSQGAA
jgi:excisionase family DNA binding protein